MEATRRKVKNNKKQEANNSKLSFFASLKVIFFIIIIVSIPVLFYNPDFSFGILDTFRQDFFKTEIQFSGMTYNAKGLEKAIKNNDIKTVKLFVRSGYNLNSYTESGNTPLCLAAENGNSEMVGILMRGNVNFVKKNRSNGMTPAFCAVKGNNVQVLEKFLSSGIGIKSGRSSKEGFSLLHYAAALGFDNMVSYLLQEGLSVNLTDSKGQTPLHMAISQDNIVVLYMLLNAGADVDAEDNEGNTPLSLAKEKGKDIYVALLQRYSKK